MELDVCSVTVFLLKLDDWLECNIVYVTWKSQVHRFMMNRSSDSKSHQIEVVVVSPVDAVHSPMVKRVYSNNVCTNNNIMYAVDVQIHISPLRF